MPTLALLGLTVAVLAVTALASPLVFAAATALGFHFTFGRLWNRVFEVLLAVAVVAAWRRLDLGDPRTLGLRRRRWARELGIGLAVGAVGLGIGLLIGWLGDGVVPEMRYPPAKTATKALSGLAAAVLLGLGEEVLFRGVLLRRLRRDAGGVVGTLLTTALYAVVHALRPSHHDHGPASTAGIARALALFAPLAHPAPWASVAGLFAFGLVLAYARIRTGSLWLCIGIHAAWVALFRVGRLFVSLRPWPVWLVGPGWPPIVGGIAGWAAVAATLLLLAIVLHRRGRAS